MEEEKKQVNFVHLHVHSHYSMLDGIGKIPDLVKKAKEDGQFALALTDHGAMHGMIEFYEECVKEGIKPILGLEIYVAARTMKDKQPRIDSSSYHLILLAKNETGYKNLMKITSVAHLEGYYYKPRIDKKTLKKYSDGLIACSACVQGEIPRKSLENIAEGRKALEEYLEIFPKEDFYLEVQHHPNTVPEQKKANENIFKLAEDEIKRDVGLLLLYESINKIDLDKLLSLFTDQKQKQQIFANLAQVRHPIVLDFLNKESEKLLAYVKK